MPRRPQVSQALDVINDLAAKILTATEERWEFYGVSPEERDRLRPGVTLQLQALAERLRDEARTRRQA